MILEFLEILDYDCYTGISYFRTTMVVLVVRVKDIGLGKILRQ